MTRLNNYPFAEYLGYYWEDNKGNLFVGSANAVEHPIEEKTTDDIVKRNLRACDYLASKQ